MYKNLIVCGVAGIAIAMAGSAMAASPITVTASGVGFESSTQTLSEGGTETFDTLSTASNGTNGATGNNSSTQNFAALFGDIIGQYTDFEIKAADSSGGAGDAGYYAVSRQNGNGTLTLNKEVNYFGFWASAFDPTSTISFYDTAVSTTKAIATFTASQLDSSLALSSAYYGYPTTPFSGQNKSQPYVYLNFDDTVGTFNEVKFTDTGAAFEGDNETVGIVKSAVSAAPEPASWALMLIGVGAAGAGLRGSHRKRAAALPAAAV